MRHLVLFLLLVVGLIAVRIILSLANYFAGYYPTIDAALNASARAAGADDTGYRVYSGVANLLPILDTAMVVAIVAAIAAVFANARSR